MVLGHTNLRTLERSSNILLWLYLPRSVFHTFVNTIAARSWGRPGSCRSCGSIGSRGGGVSWSLAVDRGAVCRGVSYDNPGVCTVRIVPPLWVRSIVTVAVTVTGHWCTNPVQHIILLAESAARKAFFSFQYPLFTFGERAFVYHSQGFQFQLQVGDVLMDGSYRVDITRAWL